MFEETTFLNEKKIMVTNARVVIDNQTYPMSAVNSVKLTVKKPDITTPVALAVVGVASFWLFREWWYSLVLIAIAAGWWFCLRNSYTVALDLLSGRQDIYTSHDKAFVTKVVQALNDAIIHRENR